MDPGNIPFNALIVGPTNSGKTHFLGNQLCGPFRGKFDYIVLICPTFAHNRTLYRFAERGPRVHVIICEQHQVENWLKVASFYFEGDNTLIVLDDCASSKDVKDRTGELVKLAFLARHVGMSACRHQRLGAGPAAIKHREAFQREFGGNRSLLHAIGKNHKGNLRRIPRRPFIQRNQSDDFKA